MRIRRVDVYAVRYTLRGGRFAMSGGRVATEQDATVVRLETDDGLVGFGEQCVFSPGFLPGHGEATRATLALLAPAVLGLDPRQVEVVEAAMRAAVADHAYARCAIDLACWDLLGKATGMRVAELLGGVFQEEVPLYTGVGIAAPEEMRARAREVVDAGYRHVQLKVGTAWREDVARVEACLDELSGADRVIVDANGFWPQAEAVQAAAALDGRDVYLEQPCASIDECLEVRRRSSRPLVLDESLTDLAALERGRTAADAVRLKLSRFGGITPLRRARDLAAAWGLQMTLEDSGGGDVVTAAMVHLSASVPQRLLLAGFLVGEMVNERIGHGAPRAVGGAARLPDAPGLGVDVDERALGPSVLRVE